MTEAAPRTHDAAPTVETSPWPGHAGRRRTGAAATATGDGAATGDAAAAGDAAASADRPQLADGVVLLGEFAGSGYREPRHLARRPDGRLVQLTQLLHLVADACDGRRDLAALAEAVSSTAGRQVSADNVATLVDRLRPLGVLADRDGRSPDVPPADPMLDLKLRTTLLPAEVTPRIARLLFPLFWPAVILATGAALIAFDIWLFFVHGLGASLRATAQQPLVFLLVAALVMVSAALHELGHAAACAYGGARPGRMGAAVYVAWPAFYTDVTDAYRLDRGGRLRTDLGGVYLNTIVVLSLAAVHAVTGYAPLLLVCFLLQVQILQQLLPLLRLDGYYVLADAVGVPDLYKRLGPLLRSLLPWRPTPPEVAELRPRVRAVVTAWVLVVVPLLLLNLVYLLVSLPRIVATGWDSAARLWGQLTAGDGMAASAMAAVQLVFLVIPTVGIGLMVVRLGRALVTRLRSWSAASPARAVLGTALALGALGFLAVTWWPDGRTTPYRQGEPGTVQQGVTELSTRGNGSPLLRSPAEAQRPLAPVPQGTSAVLAATGAAGNGAVTTDTGQPTATPSGASPSTTPTGTAGPTGTGTPAGSSTTATSTTATSTTGTSTTGTSTTATRTTATRTSGASPSGTSTGTTTTGTTTTGTTTTGTTGTVSAGASAPADGGRSATATTSQP